MKRLDRKATRMACAPAAAVLLAAAIWIAPADASRVREPTREQIRRLYHLEPYIRYFSGLRYGEDGTAVSADYIRALILSESAGDKFALSVKGARGLTQIMPATGRNAGRAIVGEGTDFRYVDERRLIDMQADALYDPALNILIACYLNARYHERFEGRHDLMAAAWNAGPEAVARHGRRTPPYAETRTFVARVMSYLAYFDDEEAGP